MIQNTVVTRCNTVIVGDYTFLLSLCSRAVDINYDLTEPVHKLTHKVNIGIGIQKSVSLKKLDSGAFFRKYSEVFNYQQATRVAVITAGD